MSREPGSFRDPAGAVFSAGGRIFRGISSPAATHFRNFIGSSFFRKHAGTRIVQTREIHPEEAQAAGISANDVHAFAMWVEHESLPFISYPHEWSFTSLQRAACLTLQLLIDGLQNGYILKDASADNVQFVNSRPIFIDVLSFDVYQDGAPFLGYRQFCEQFLAPLCLTAFANIDFNAWLRGRPGGLDLTEVTTTLPVRTWLQPTTLLHIHLHAFAMRRLKSTAIHSQRKPRPVRRENLIALARSMKRFMARLQRRKTSYWQDYTTCNPYDKTTQAHKIRIVQEFIGEHNILKLLDLGCNTGTYSGAAMQAGAKQIIGIDLDCGAIDCATREARRQTWPAQFLHYDITNPSPSQGWKHAEQRTLEERLGNMDAVLCLALIHHIVIGKNIPLNEFISWVCKLATRGLIEFVPKVDPMAQELLRNREDIFQQYSQNHFEQILNALCKYVNPHPVQGTHRILYEYET